jgi:hypothetical protein
MENEKMNAPQASPIYVAQELLGSRFKGADIIFVAGSVARGEANSSSDLDLLVVFPKIEAIRAESFIHRGWPVEAIVHDLSSIRAVAEDLILNGGDSSVLEMISEGLEVTDTPGGASELKALALTTLSKGPPKYSEDELLAQRYHLSTVIDDIRQPRSSAELMASAVALFEDGFAPSEKARSADDAKIYRSLRNGI